ncbi:MAG: hypothetical protein ACRYGP_01560 [Janthinobacterium lividum]
MSEPMNFVDQAMAGLVAINDIDDFVDRWHDGEETVAIFDFLGMTEEEYGLWMQAPDTLELILRARRLRLPLVEAVKDDAGKSRTSAASEEALKLELLQTWLRGREALNAGRR